MGTANWRQECGGDGCSQSWKAANGLTIGILPTDDTNAISKAVDIAIITDMGNARNILCPLSDVVIACGMGAGTASEIALALKGIRKLFC